MRYWPMSVIASSPLMPAPHAFEVANMGRRPPSKAAFNACFEVAMRTEGQPMHGLAFIESVGAPARQVFTEYPCWEDWSRLERVALVETNGNFFIIIDTEH